MNCRVSALRRTCYLQVGKFPTLAVLRATLTETIFLHCFLDARQRLLADILFLIADILSNSYLSVGMLPDNPLWPRSLSQSG